MAFPNPARSISALIPNFFAVDVVGIFTSEYRQLFQDARPIKAVVKEESKLMEHPVETGIITTDHAIVLPIEIELSVVLISDDYAQVYQAIKQVYLNKTLLIVQTKVGIYTDQIIQSMPHEENPEQFDTIALAIKLKQVQFVTAQYGVVPAKASNANAIARGVQQPAPLTSVASDGLTKATSSLKSLMTRFQ